MADLFGRDVKTIGKHINNGIFHTPLIERGLKVGLPEISQDIKNMDLDCGQYV